MPEQGEDALSDREMESIGLKRDADGHYRVPIPERANIAADTVAKHAAGARSDHPALVFEAEDGTLRRWTFAELDRAAAAFARGLSRLGVGQGDPVGVHTGQRPETAIAHLAIYKLGAIVVTLSQLYGPETLRHILGDCALRVILTEPAAVDDWQALGVELGVPVRLVTTERQPRAVADVAALLDAGSEGFEPVATRSADPALLMYTSGSTGKPKGLLHGHRVLHAYLPTVSLFYNLELQHRECVLWTPADWAWVGGLLDLVLPAWFHGHTVVASQHRFDQQWALEFMSRHRVTHVFMTPTGLKRLAEVGDPRSRHELALRVICTGGESLPSEIVRWCEEKLGAVCNEFYGLTEFNHLVGNCKRLYPIRPGSMGRTYPGHVTLLVDEGGNPVPRGEVGEIVSTTDDPTLFLGYWGDPGIPQRLRLGARLVRTGDLARQDADGYFWYQGRNDDLIKSAGYRIGPAEVEDALVSHPDVAEAAVIASPDAERGAIVKAYIRLRQGVVPSAPLVRELQDYVKRNLAAYKYPREIEFVDDFPLTSSGKIRRTELRRRNLEAIAARTMAP
ncbi:MAG: AMP-binding protein [Betaproteobacteria bacterium]